VRFGTRVQVLCSLLGAVALLALACGSAAAKLPRTYQAQTVDSPNPTPAGDFGIGFVNTGDVNGDGKDDLLVGTDEHGGSTGQVFVMSGANGSAIRTINSPDGDGSGTKASFGAYVGKIADVASCPGGAPGQVCPNNPSGGPDGVPDELVTALGVDVLIGSGPNTLADAGRAYVVDGATGAILKRLQMPDSDLNEQFDAPGGPAKPAFGRTILSPAGQPPCAGNMSIGKCASVPDAVRIGDLDGGGKPDVLVGASDYFETDATANPDSPCAASASSQCLQAGREYVLYGESFTDADGTGTDPTTIDNAPDQTIKNPTAQPDDLSATTNTNRESMGYSITPVGDLGTCTSGGGEGVTCPRATTSGTADGRPDYVLSSHRTDEFGMFDVGVAYVVDGPTGSILATYHHPEPQPASIFAFSNYNQPAIGDVGGTTTTPDVYEPAMRQNNPYTGGGRGYVMNGSFLQTGSPNAISFATLNDPTPHPSEDFGTSSAGIGDVAGAEAGLDNRGEVLVGAYGPHNPGTNGNVVNDVHIFSALTEQALQSIDPPDPQPGAGFGTALAPLGDLNGDGFLDVAVGAGLYDVGGNANQGRIYIFRSDDSPAPTQPAASTQGTQGAAASVTVVNGRTVDLAASADSVRRGRRVRLSVVVEAFAGGTSCTANQVVALQRRAPHTAGYRTFAFRRTSSRGRLSTLTKPTTTRLYRARVSQTATCGGAVSGAQRVTVTRRRSARSARRG